MTNLELIPAAVASMLREMPDRPAEVEVLERKNADLDSDIDAALGKLGMCMHVLPAKPLRAMQKQGVGPVIFDEVEIRVRVVETPIMNGLPFDGQEMAGRVCDFLNGENPGDLFMDLLNPAPRPCEETGVFDEETQRLSINYDAIFIAPLQLKKLP